MEYSMVPANKQIRLCTNEEKKSILMCFPNLITKQAHVARPFFSNKKSYLVDAEKPLIAGKM